MAKEALLQIKDAEDEVKKMLSSAQQKNQEKINNAEIEGKNIYDSLVQQGKEEANSVMEAAENKGNEEAAPIIEKGMAEVEALRNVDKQKFDNVVKLVIERIVNNNGNC